jgi:hypothetical protein
VTKFDHHDHEYLVEYEDDDSEAWHEWEDLAILPERSPKLQPRRPPPQGLDGLLMLATQSQSSGGGSSGHDSGLFALSELAANDEPCSLKEYARAVEEKVTISCSLRMTRNFHDLLRPGLGEHKAGQLEGWGPNERVQRRSLRNQRHRE